MNLYGKFPATSLAHEEGKGCSVSILEQRFQSHPLHTSEINTHISHSAATLVGRDLFCIVFLSIHFIIISAY